MKSLKMIKIHSLDNQQKNQFLKLSILTDYLYLDYFTENCYVPLIDSEAL